MTVRRYLIVIGIGHVCKTGFGIPGGFHRQLRALRVRSAFERVFVWAASCKTKYVKFACKLGNAYVSCGIFKSLNQ